MSPPAHERGPVLETMLAPLPLPANSVFSVSYHVQDTVPYENISKKMYRSCIVCGRSADAIKREKADDYIRKSTPRSEPAHVTAKKKEAYLNGLNAGSFLFIRTKYRTRNASYILLLKLKINQSQCSIASIISQ